MDHECKGLLAKNKVPEVVRAYLEAQGCETVTMLGNWIDEKDSLMDIVISKCAKDNRQAFASLKGAMSEARATADRKVKRAADGLNDEDIDEPLPDALQMQIESAFLQKYDWKLKPQERCADAQLARFRREFDRKLPGMWSLSKTRLLSQTQRGGDRKRRNFGEAVLEFLDDTPMYDADRDDGRLRHVFVQHTVVANTWALAGCVQIEYPTKSGKQVWYVHWREVLDYFKNMYDRTHRLADRYTEVSVIDYLTKVEELTRTEALLLARDRESPMPWGMALLQATKENHHLWHDHKDILRTNSKHEPRVRREDTRPVRKATRDDRRGGRDPPPPPPRRENNTRAVNQPRSQQLALPAPTFPPAHPQLALRDSGNVRRGNAVTTSEIGGTKVCKAYNDARGCPGRDGRCPKGFVHKCDIVLQSGRPCGGTSHNRTNHDNNSHGAPQLRGQ